MKRYAVDLGNLPPLSEQHQSELRDLSKLPDSGIDYSDIPAHDDSFWLSAMRNPFYKPVKTLTTLRVDADVLAWFKRQGKGYQTRMNDILRQAMIRGLQEIS